MLKISDATVQNLVALVTTCLGFVCLHCELCLHCFLSPCHLSTCTFPGDCPWSKGFFQTIPHQASIKGDRV